MLSRRLKGKWSLRRRRGFHSTLLVLSILRHHSILSLHIGIIFHSYIIYQRGRQLIEWALMTPFLAIHAKGGESISPKQKDRTQLKISNWNWKFQIGILIENFRLVSYDSKGGESSISKINILKPSWTLRGGFNLGGVLFSQKKKHLK
jgi:hypothetical protein